MTPSTVKFCQLCHGPRVFGISHRRAKPVGTLIARFRHTVNRLWTFANSLSPLTAVTERMPAIGKRNTVQVGCIILSDRHIFFAVPAAGSPPATYLDRLPEKGADSLA